MIKSISSTGLRWLWLALLVFVLDIASKYWVILTFQQYESVNLLPFFSFTYVHNIGAAFSSFEGYRWLLASVAIIVSITLIVMLYRTPADDKIVAISFALIIGGALGNLVDRLYHGYVVDFLHFFIGNWSYPIFNLADTAICIGAGLIIIGSFCQSRRCNSDKIDNENETDTK